MRIKWLGHSCFKISSEGGIRILTDPFDDNVGYKLPSVETDIITISHGHFDHNFIDCVKGNFEVINRVGNFYIKDIPITGIHTYHDEVNGEKRGDNIIFIFEVDGVRICHLGDIGHTLSPSQLQMIGEVDILLIPIGGIYTLDAEGAFEVIEQLKPSIIIPMHYKTPSLKFELEGADKFISKMGDVKSLESKVFEIKKQEINKDERRVYLLRYE